jgi:hypothetical protein
MKSPLLPLVCLALLVSLGFALMASGKKPMDDSFGAVEVRDEGPRLDEEPAPTRPAGALPTGADGLDVSKALAAGAVDGLEVDEGVTTFAALSLLGTDINALLENLFAEEGDETQPYEFPEEVRALDGEELRLLGYMIPVQWKDRDVTEFMLVRDLASCCFGGIPRPDEWVLVTMQEGHASPYHAYVPVIVTGVLEIFEAHASDLDMTAVYSMTATEVEKYY